MDTKFLIHIGADEAQYKKLVNQFQEIKNYQNQIEGKYKSVKTALGQAFGKGQATLIANVTKRIGGQREAVRSLVRQYNALNKVMKSTIVLQRGGLGSGPGGDTGANWYARRSPQDYYSKGYGSQQKSSTGPAQYATGGYTSGKHTTGPYDELALGKKRMDQISKIGNLEQTTAKTTNQLYNERKKIYEKLFAVTKKHQTARNKREEAYEKLFAARDIRSRYENQRQQQKTSRIGPAQYATTYGTTPRFPPAINRAGPAQYATGGYGAASARQTTGPYDEIAAGKRRMDQISKIGKLEQTTAKTTNQIYNERKKVFEKLFADSLRYQEADEKFSKTSREETKSKGANELAAQQRLMQSSKKRNLTEVIGMKERLSLVQKTAKAESNLIKLKKKEESVAGKSQKVRQKAELKRIGAETKLEGLKFQAKNAVIAQNRALKAATTELLPKEQERAIKGLERLRTSMTNLQNVTGSDVMKKNIGNLKRDLDGMDTRLATTNTRKEFDALNKKIDTTKKQFGQLDSQHTKTSKNMGKNQSFINTKFGKFSIIMSGIAASLFVFQEALQLIRLILAPITRAEKAWTMLYTQVQGTTEELGKMYDAAEKIDLAGTMNIDEATSQLNAFRKAGHSVEEAIDRIRIISAVTAEGEANTLTDFFKGLGARFDATMRGTKELSVMPGEMGLGLPGETPGYVPIVQKIEFVAVVNGVEYRDPRKAMEALILEARAQTAQARNFSMLGIETHNMQRQDEKNIRNQREALATIVTGGDDPAMLDKFEDAARRKDWEKRTKPRLDAHKKVFDSIGRMTETYYLDQYAIADNMEKDLTDLIGEKLAKRLADNKKFNLDIAQERAKFIRFPVSAEKRIEKSFKETGIATRGYEKTLEWKRREEQMRIAAKGSRAEKELAPLLLMKREYEDFKSLRKTMTEINKNYFEQTGKLAEGAYNTQFDFILRERDIRVASNMDILKSNEILEKDLRKLSINNLKGSISFMDGLTRGQQILDAEYHAGTAEIVSTHWVKAAGEMEKAWDQGFFAIVEANFDSLADVGVSALEAIRDSLGSLVNDLIKASMQPVLSSFFGSWFNVPAGTAATAGPGPVVAPDGGVAVGHFGGVMGSGGFSALPRFHSGTTGLNSGEYPAILKRGEAVIPGDKLGKLGGNVKVIINNYSDEKVQATERQPSPGAEREIMVAIGNNISSGGPIGQSMERTYPMLKRTGRMT